MSERSERLHLFLTGCLAGLVTVAFMLVWRSVSGEPSLVELLGEAFIQSVPVSVFTFFLQTLQQAAKPLLLLGVISGFIVIGGGIGRLAGGVAREYRWVRRLRGALLLALGIWVPLAIVVLVVTSYGTLTPLSNNQLMQLALVLAADTLVFATALYMLYPFVRSAVAPSSTQVDIAADAPAADLGRRRLLATAGLGSVAVLSLGYTGRFVRGVGSGALGGSRGVIPQPLTPVGEFYVISKNFVDPNVARDDWQLQVTGLVERPQSLRFADLAAMPAQDQLTTLTCISNPIGGDLISNARWTGVSLADLLGMARLRPGASEIVLYAHDGYTESLPIAKALEATTMLVYLMNGEPLTTRHGFPARLIVPGKYGIKNVKWLRRIDVIAGDYRGFWQQRGWTDDATIQTMSRIDVPRSRAIVEREPLEIGGVAYAGDRGVVAVEWSADGGDSWQAADSVEYVAALSWVIWRSTWNPSRSGSHRLIVRATDGAGETQTPQRRDPIPDGATGWHSIDVGVT
jgi:DMSO/TMAO reductase YedYZ molybdopterin-dependent catalytic subunit